MSLDGRAVVQADTYRWRSVAAKDVVGDSKAQEHGFFWVGDPQHYCVADGLDARAAELVEVGLNCR